MKIFAQIVFTILAIFLSNINVNAQQLILSQLSPTSIDKPTLFPSEREELTRLRQEKEIRDRVQSEVDRTFRHTTILLNILLLVLILLPIGTAIVFLLLRNNIINQIVSDIKTNLQVTQSNLQAQLQQQVALEFKAEAERYQQIQTLNNHDLEQLQQVNLESQQTLKELIFQKELTEQAIQSLKLGLESHLASPDLDRSLNSLQENDSLVLVSDNLTYSVSDYIQQAENLFNQGLYEEANKFYNDALKIERDLPEIRYQNARCYALRYSVNLAIGNLQWAIDINPMYKEMAKTDSAFNSIRNDEKFKQVFNL